MNIRSAIAFIVKAHAGQMYGDMPYFLHPMQVAATLRNPTKAEFIAALLHDVEEDTIYDNQYIYNVWGAEVAAITALLTKYDDLNYVDNIARIIDSGNVSAMRVKLADNMVNAASNKDNMPAERRERLTNQYRASMIALRAALGERVV